TAVSRAKLLHFPRSVDASSLRTSRGPSHGDNRSRGCFGEAHPFHYYALYCAGSTTYPERIGESKIVTLDGHDHSHKRLSRDTSRPPIRACYHFGENRSYGHHITMAFVVRDGIH